MKSFTLTPEITLYLGDTPPRPFIAPQERLEWINALNSGEYLQGLGQLKNVNAVDGIPRYCCLGVKSELESDENNKFIDDKFQTSDGTSSECCYIGKCKALGSLGYFPNYTYVKLNIIYNSIKTSLAECNDHGIPFPLIAQIINIVWCSETWFPYYVPPTTNLS